MALNSILRRASSSVLPLAFRSVAAPRSFHNAMSAAITIGKHNFSKELNPNFFLPFLRSYSAAPAKKDADVNLIRVLESEIKYAEEDEQNSVSSLSVANGSMRIFCYVVFLCALHLYFCILFLNYSTERVLKLADALSNFSILQFFFFI